MAEYYPLLAKAIAGLPNSTPDMRRAVYERARKALLTQLQSLQPPVPEADIARETEALDMAMARLEAELTAGNGSAAEVLPALVQPQILAEGKTASNIPASKPAPPHVFTPRSPLPQHRPNGIAPASLARAKHRAIEAAESTDDSVAAEPPREHVEVLRPEVLRPHAPQLEVDDAPQGRRLWIVIAVVVVVVSMVAVAAWKLRDRPEELASFKAATQSQPAQSGKIVERIGGGPTESPAQSATAVSQTAPQTAAPQAASVANPAETSTDNSSTVPVAYRAALLVEAPEEASKVKTYVGTVIWKLDNVSNGPGQPLGTAVHADIDIPEDKMKASLDIEKNADASLSASHTITIVFTMAPDSPTGGVKQISVPQLRGEDSPNGEPLKGILVPIMENSFLIGLARGDAETSNIDLIKQREWFDIPILLGNGRVAKLTFEKNVAGDRAIQDALASWQTQ
jgi:hypothetical protein